MSQLEAIDFLKEKLETKQTYHIGYSDFLDFLEQFYGIVIELTEVNNYTTYEYKVKNQYDEVTEKNVQEAVKNGYAYDYREILEDLCHKGYIEPGSYFIRAWW